MAHPDIADRPSAAGTRAPLALVAAAWTVATLILLALAMSVVQHLSQPGMPAMADADALYRQGAGPSGPLLGGALVTAWHLDAVGVAVLVLLAAAYVTGIARARRRGVRWPAARTASFAAGLVVCGYATCGAIAVYDMSLFSAHMVGHLLLIMVAPALLVAGRPLRLLISGSTPRTAAAVQAVLRSRAVALVTAPPVALACYAVVIVGTHLTGFMDEVMRSAALGQLEHLLYLVVGVQFFLLIVGDEPIRWQIGIPLRWLFLALAMAVDTITGIVLLQQQTPIAMMPAPGLEVDPLLDTRTGGAIMWVGGDGIMVLIMIGLVVAWLRLPERDRRGSLSWLEDARRAHFVEHAAALAGPAAASRDGGETSLDRDRARAADSDVDSGLDSDLDSDDRQRDAYNAYLQSLHARRR